MKNLFESLRQEEKTWNTREKTFAGELFGETPWYFFLPSVNTENFVKKPLAGPTEVEVSPRPVPRVLTRPSPSGASLASLVKTLESCRKCPQECIKDRAFVVHHYQGKEYRKPPLVFFVGDFPRNEELSEQGAFPFAGERGELLRKIVRAMNLREGEYAFGLVAKCPPPDEEKAKTMAETCLSHLKREIHLLRPQFVIGLGAFAARHLLSKEERLSTIHGQFFPVNFAPEGEEAFVVNVVPIFHPDYLLINPNMKKTTWMDLIKIMNHLVRTGV